MTKLNLKALAKRLKPAKRTLIFCHKNPDPDTLGSAFALKYILEHFGSEVRIAGCDEASAKFEFITRGAKLKDKFNIDDYERVIAIDVGSEAQLGDYSNFASSVDLIIDHHECSSRFADYYEDFAPACAMIVYELAQKMKLIKKLPKHFFECVYAGLSGDTGCFKYSNTSSKALIMASRLISTGINFADINYIIFDRKSIYEISAQRMAYDNISLFLDGKLAVLLVTNEMKARYGISDDDISDIVNTIRQIQGVLIAVSIKQSSIDEGKFSISSRANADIDVSELCARLGGGGHPRAAGATLTNTDPEQALRTIKNLFSEGVIKYGA